MSERTFRKVRVGIVVSNRMQKTIVVRVDRLTQHPLFSRVITQSTSFKAHDETNTARIGDRVKIMETRPISKDKRWRLVDIVQRASTAPAVPGGSVDESVKHREMAKTAAAAKQRIPSKVEGAPAA